MDKLSYSFGLAIGSQLVDLGAETIRVDDFAQALKDVFAGQQPAVDPSEAQHLVNDFIQKFRLFVEQNLSDSSMNVETIGAELGLSRVQLYRKVKALTGCTPVDLLRKARLSKALALLADPELTVSEIAYRVGFTSPSYFTKCFKDEYGKVPGDVR